MFESDGIYINELDVHSYECIKFNVSFIFRKSENEKMTLEFKTVQSINYNRT